MSSNLSLVNDFKDLSLKDENKLEILKNYGGKYFKILRERTQFGDITIQQGILPSFPDYFQTINGKIMNLHSADLMNKILFQKSMKICFEKRMPLVQWLCRDKFQIVFYNASPSQFGVYKIKTKNHQKTHQPVQEKPYVIKLNRILLLFWLKNAAQLQIYNTKNFSIEQTILLSKKDSFISIERIYPDKKASKLGQFLHSTNPTTPKQTIYYLCLRNHQYLNYYELQLDQYPYMKLQNKIDIQQTQEVTCYSIMNFNYVCNFMSNGMQEAESDIQIIDKRTMNQTIINKNADDKVVMLNQKFNSTAQPILIKYSEQQLSLMVDYQNQIFDPSIFQNFNQLNCSGEFIYMNSFIYCEEIQQRNVIIILRKIHDGRAIIWRIKIPRAFIRNIANYLQ